MRAKVARQIKSVTNFPVGPLASEDYLCRKKSASKADEFFKKWGAGSPHPVQQKLQKKLMKMAAENNGRVHDVVRTALLIQAWNHFIKGQRGATTKLDWVSAAGVPEHPKLIASLLTREERYITLLSRMQ